MKLFKKKEQDSWIVTTPWAVDKFRNLLGKNKNYDLISLSCFNRKKEVAKAVNRLIESNKSLQKDLTELKKVVKRLGLITSMNGDFAVDIVNKTLRVVTRDYYHVNEFYYDYENQEYFSITEAKKEKDNIWITVKRTTTKGSIETRYMANLNGIVEV